MSLAPPPLESYIVATLVTGRGRNCTLDGMDAFWGRGTGIIQDRIESRGAVEFAFLVVSLTRLFSAARLAPMADGMRIGVLVFEPGVFRAATWPWGATFLTVIPPI